MSRVNHCQAFVGGQKAAMTKDVFFMLANTPPSLLFLKNLSDNWFLAGSRAAIAVMAPPITDSMEIATKMTFSLTGLPG
jgi:hypothetical protein